MPMTRFLTLFDTVVTDPLEDIPTVNELEKWLKNVGEQAFYFFIRLAAAGLLLFIGSKLIKFLMNRFKRSKLYQKMDPGLASFMASGSRIVLYIILILVAFLASRPPRSSHCSPRAALPSALRFRAP